MNEMYYLMRDFRNEELGIRNEKLGIGDGPCRAWSPDHAETTPWHALQILCQIFPNL